MKTIELHRTENHIILVSAVNFADLKDIVMFSNREYSNWSSEKDEDELNGFYQRATNDLRIKKIKKYIQNTLIDSPTSDILFPSSLIINVNIDSDDLIAIDGIIDLPIKEIENKSCLIVDGQHRMKAMMELFKELQQQQSGDLEKLERYKFNCTILINYDLWEQAKIFANVNFNQKPVDRSLYYDIFGDTPESLRDKRFSNLYVAHELGKYLNTSLKSPLRGFVKNFSSKKGFVSQAFLTQAILNLLGPKSNWGDVVSDYQKGGSLYKNLPAVFVSYFSAINRFLPEYWPKSLNKEDSQILSKTNALGALIRLLGKIDSTLKLGLFPNFKAHDLLILTSEELEQLFTRIFSIFDQSSDRGRNLAKHYFSKDSRYSGGGSSGLQNQMFKDLANEIGISQNEVNR